MTDRKIPYTDLATSDLILDCVYEGGRRGNAGDDPIARLLPVGNMGGIRCSGSIAQNLVRIVVLYTSGVEIDWPDHLDPMTGDFTYYGDNRQPGTELHDTPRGGNALLRDLFSTSRASSEMRRTTPPIFLFERVSSRDVRFRGLLVPGSGRLTTEEELVAIWRTTRNQRFQNYRAHFTVLRTAVISRAWIDEILDGNPIGDACPKEWREWVEGGVYCALEAPRNASTRSKEEQLPAAEDMWIVQKIYQYFSPDPVKFEAFAAEMWRQFDPHVVSIDLTRPSRDGGRDAIGEYRIGPVTDPIRFQFALEAKCYDPNGHGIGVKSVSRLISRIKHREFGVFVTTGFIGGQAYHEVREDGHYVIFLSGRDIADFIKGRGIIDQQALETYLENEFPITEDLSASIIQ